MKIQIPHFLLLTQLLQKSQALEIKAKQKPNQIDF